MHIDWQVFTPAASWWGGVIIGSAAAVYLLALGRIAGISGLLGEPLRQLGRGLPWAPQMPRLLFIAGLFAAPGLWQIFAPLPTVTIGSDTGTLVAAGLLVGVGTRMGSGCTSGHGVCGLSRFSVRSLVNVLAFMGAGFATTFVLRHVL
jgi:uncharacterized protein